MRRTIGRLTTTGAVAALLLVATQSAPALAGGRVPVRFERIAGYHAPGTPLKYDRVGILEIGHERARNILVLNPGTSASAAYFAPLAKWIVKLAPNWQVWAVERRENLLEDQSVFDLAKEHKATPRQVFDYYLGWLVDPSIKHHFQMIPDSKVAFARGWGMNVEINDLRRVVLRAQRRAKHVVVGGHSLGGTITTAYATWDFHGKPGAKGLSGLVFIDGGSFRTSPTAEQAKASLDQLARSTPWLTFGGIPAPFTGLYNTSGALSVIQDPNSPSLGQQFPLLPAALKPPVPATNEAQYGYALDTETSPPGLIAAQAHLGHLAPSGNPRGWVRAGELTPIRRYAEMFSGWGLKGLDGTAWYHPMRLTIDAGAINQGRPTPAQKVLGDRSIHGRDLPRRLRIYAFGAALGGQAVLDGARQLAAQSGIPMRHLVLVDRHTTYAHNDPNSAYPNNAFVRHLIPFLQRIARPR